MTQTVTKLLHHISPAGKEIASLELYYPRAILHEEVMTHRAFSRNASSSRATPIQSMIDQVRVDPALPIRWGTNGKGMQDHGVMSEENAAKAMAVWLKARDEAIERVGELMILPEQPHKQICNLLLRPWEHIRVVVTATDWANFFAQRRHEAAKPEFYDLADKMWKALKSSEPKPLAPGEWHLPYVQQHEIEAYRRAKGEKRDQMQANLIKVSAARCARTSYKNHRGKVATFAEDIDLYNFLVDKHHPSPLEHQATPDTSKLLTGLSGGKMKLKRVYDNPELHGNFSGYIQHRKTLPGENIMSYNPED